MRVASFLLLGSEGILLRHETQRLYYLNTTAAFVWCCLEEGLDPSAIAPAVAEQFGISISVARRDVFAALSLWQSEGLIGTARLDAAEGSTPDPDENGAPLEGSSSQSALLATDVAGNGERVPHPLSGQCEDRRPPGANSALPGTLHHEHCYGVGDAVLRVRYWSEKSEAIVHSVLMHLEVAATLTKRRELVTLDITEDASGFSLSRDGARVRDAMRRQELAPAVHREALLAAYASTDCLAGIHAGAVRNEYGCLLLPGAPGSGKSTLTAALVAEGFTYLSDDLALIVRDTHVIRPAPVSIGLKRGSWAVLAHAFPGVEALSTYCQEDGTEVRYLAPPKTQLPSDSGSPAALVVFPTYEPQGPTELTRISAAKALYRLAEAGYAIRGQLEPRVVEDLIAWITPLECYELRLSVLSEAISKLKGLLAGTGCHKREL